ncbi:MAG: DUF4743 domain-containing protein [Alphaproteobacteria bacterium]|nr:DUF4743 domain-containing protein [Alphaproteobacteria bacterium]
MGYLDHIQACNNADLSQFRPFHVAGQRVGWLQDEFVAQLAAWPDVFDLDEEKVTLKSATDNFEARSLAIKAPLRDLAETGAINGWRREYFPVMKMWGDPPLMQMERSSRPHFGTCSWAVALNGFVSLDDGLYIWIAYRAKDKPTFPGMLDVFVGGGLPIGIAPRDNLIKECAEEARIPREISDRIRSTSVVSYCHQALNGVKPDQVFCYDVEMPAEFVPVNRDGEIDRFELWPVEEVAARIRDSFDFKFNCNLVIIDFLVRHGYITPENEPDYMAIVLGLRQAG